MSKRQSIEALLEFYAPDKEMEYGFLTHIGKKVGTTREYVRQVAEMNGYKMATAVSRERSKRVCWVDGMVFINQRKLSICSPKCMKIHYEQKYWMIYQCPECKFYFKARKAYIKLRGQRFCSKTCQGRWLARTYGWVKGKSRPRLYKSEEQVLKDFPRVFQAKEFSIKYGYTSHGGAYIALHGLVLRGTLEKIAYGTYRPKEKAPIDLKSPGA